MWGGLYFVVSILRGDAAVVPAAEQSGSPPPEPANRLAPGQFISPPARTAALLANDEHRKMR